MYNKTSIIQKFDALAKFMGRPAFYHTLLAKFYQFHVPQGKRVLEIGCGAGDLLAALKPSYGVGLDLSPGMIARAKAHHPQLSFVVADAHTFEIQEKFDYIILSDLIGYLDDVQAVLERIKKNTHEHTRIIINYYNFLWEQPLKFAETLGLKRKTDIQNWLSMADIENLVFLADLDMIKTGRALLFPFNKFAKASSVFLITDLTSIGLMSFLGLTMTFFFLISIFGITATSSFDFSDVIIFSSGVFGDTIGFETFFTSNSLLSNCLPDPKSVSPKFTVTPPPPPPPTSSAIFDGGQKRIKNSSKSNSKNKVDDKTIDFVLSDPGTFSIASENN